MEKAIENSDHLDEIERNYQTRDAAGHWGVPTMVVRGEPFFVAGNRFLVKTV